MSRKYCHLVLALGKGVVDAALLRLYKARTLEWLDEGKRWAHVYIHEHVHLYTSMYACTQTRTRGLCSRVPRRLATGKMFAGIASLQTVEGQPEAPRTQCLHCRGAPGEIGPVGPLGLR